MASREGWGVRRRLHLLACVAALVLVSPGSVAEPAGAATAGVTFSARLDQRSLDQVDLDRPLHLDPHRELNVVVTVRNDGRDPVLVRSVRIAATVLGAPLFAYSTRVDLEVQPGRSGTRRFVVDVSDVGSQAIGLFRAQVTLLGRQRVRIASTGIVVQVHGSMFSVFGLFGIGVIAMTLVLLLGALWRLATGRLPPSRWGRALPFGIAGVGGGVSLTFLLAALSIEAFTPTTWVVMLVIGLAAGLAFGYVSPRAGASSDTGGSGEPAAVG